MRLHRKTDSKKGNETPHSLACVSALRKGFKLNILGDIWTIKSRQWGMKNYYGLCYLQQRKIHINNRHSGAIQMETAQHEIFHSLLYRQHVYTGAKYEEEEKVVTRLSEAYFVFLSVNPQFTKLLAGFTRASSTSGFRGMNRGKEYICKKEAK